MAARPLAVKFTTEGFQEAIASLKQVGRSFDEALDKANKSAQDAIKIAQGPKLLAAEFEKVTQQFEKAAKDANNAIAGSFRELRIKSTADIEAQKNQAISAFEAIKKSGTASAKDIENAQVALTRRLAELDGQVNKSAATVEQAATGGYTVFGNVLANLTTNLIQGAITQLQQLAGNVVAAGSTAERQAVAFETFLGSAQKAQEMMAKVREFAATTPFELPEVTEAAKQLLAVKVPADEVINTIKRLGEISAGADKPLSQLLFVYTQVKNQGRALGQDINQLLNAGLSMEDIAKALGKSAEELGKMKSSSRGLQLSFEDVQKVILGVTSEGGRFYGLMDKLGDTTAVKLSNLNDAFTKLYLQIYDAIAPALSAVLDVIVQTLDPLSENEQLFSGIKDQAKQFQEYIAQNPELIKALNDGLTYTLNVAFKGVTDLAKQFLEYLKANPGVIEQTIDKVKFLVDIMGGFVGIINKAIEGWMMIFDLVGKTWEFLKQPAFQFGGKPAGQSGQGNLSGVVGYVGNTGVGTGAHLDVRGYQADRTRRLSPERLKELFADIYVGNKSLSEQTNLITSGYGARKAPVAGASKFHPAFDFGFAAGTPIEYRGQAVKIEKKANVGGGGNVIQITLPTGEILQLLHLQKFGDAVIDAAAKQVAAAGQAVAAGQDRAMGSSTIGRGASSGATPKIPYWDLIQQAAIAQGIDPFLLAGLFKKESTFNPRAVSPTGNKGLGQLGDAEARMLGVKNVFDPAQNIAGSAKYLKQLLDQFNNNIELALAAYNAGPGNVRRARGIPNNKETLDYVRLVPQYADEYRKQYGDGAGSLSRAAAASAVEQKRQDAEAARERKRQDAAAKRLGKEDVNQFGNIFQDMIRAKKAEAKESQEALGDALTEGFNRAKEGFKAYQDNLKYLDDNLKKVKETFVDFKNNLLPDSPEKEAALAIEEINRRYTEFSEKLQENIDKLNAVIAAKQRNNLDTATESAELERLNGLMAEANGLRGQEIAQTQQQIQLANEQALNAVAGYGYAKKFKRIDEATTFDRAAERLSGINEQAGTLQDTLDTLGETAMGSAKDGLVDFFDTVFSGTQSAGDAFVAMGRQILQTLAQIAIQMAVTQIFAAFGGGGAGVGASIGRSIGGGFAEGGYTGRGSKYQVAGLVHANEFVFSSEAVRNIGLNTLEKLHRGDRSLSLPVGFGDGRSQGSTKSVNITTTVVTPNADSFAKSERQIGREQGEAIRRAMT